MPGRTRRTQNSEASVEDMAAAVQMAMPWMDLSQYGNAAAAEHVGRHPEPEEDHEFGHFALGMDTWHTYAELAEHAQHVETPAAPLFGAFVGPLAVAAGLHELHESHEAAEHGKQTEAALLGLQGSASVTGGVGAMGGALGAATGTEVAIGALGPLATSLGLGLLGGQVMDQAAHDSGAVTREEVRPNRAVDSGKHVHSESLGMSEYLEREVSDARAEHGDAAAIYQASQLAQVAPIAWGGAALGLWD